MADSAAASDEGFGRYLASVAERDIDLLLMEEFHISDDFVTWFCDQLGLNGVTPAGAWHTDRQSGRDDRGTRVGPGRGAGDG